MCSPSSTTDSIAIFWASYPYSTSPTPIEALSLWGIPKPRGQCKGATHIRDGWSEVEFCLLLSGTQPSSPPSHYSLTGLHLEAIKQLPPSCPPHHPCHQRGKTALPQERGKFGDPGELGEGSYPLRTRPQVSSKVQESTPSTKEPNRIQALPYPTQEDEPHCACSPALKWVNLHSLLLQWF